MTTTIPGRLEVDKATGRLTGPAHITYNDPWPLKFAGPGVTGQMDGVVEHTMAGWMDYTIEYFNGRAKDASGNVIKPGGSAHLAIGTIGKNDGRIHQFVPFGQGFETYHAFAANLRMYGIETEDGGKPATPVSDLGLWAWGQCFEALSRYAGFPCQVLVSAGGRGLGYHRQFPAWNLSQHSCPGATMTDMVRVNQRTEIVRRALLIRNPPAPPPPPPSPEYAYLVKSTLQGFTGRTVMSHDEGVTWA
jgi:hypothetical protein